jgi:hypothetical protein
MENRASVIRPYPLLKKYMVGVLRAVHVDVADEDVLAPESTVEDIIGFLKKHPNEFSLLLLPYYPRNDREQNLLHGLEILRRIQKEVPEYRHVKKIMPINAIGRMTYQQEAKAYQAELADPNLLVLDEEEISDDRQALLHKISSFLGVPAAAA